MITINKSTPKISGSLSIKSEIKELFPLRLNILLKKSLISGNENFNHKYDKAKTIVMIILLVKSKLFKY